MGLGNQEKERLCMVHVKAPRLANPRLHSPSNTCEGLESWCCIKTCDPLFHQFPQKTILLLQYRQFQRPCLLSKDVQNVLIRPRTREEQNPLHYKKGFLDVMTNRENHCNGILCVGLLAGGLQKQHNKTRIIAMIVDNPVAQEGFEGFMWSLFLIGYLYTLNSIMSNS